MTSAACYRVKLGTEATGSLSLTISELWHKYTMFTLGVQPDITHLLHAKLVHSVHFTICF